MDYTTLAAYLALTGTAIQAYWRLSSYWETNQEVADTFIAIEGLRTEFSFRRHPVKRMKRRREVRRWLRTEPDLRRDYRRVRWELLSWTMLVLSAAYVCMAVS